MQQILQLLRNVDTYPLSRKRQRRHFFFCATEHQRKKKEFGLNFELKFGRFLLKLWGLSAAEVCTFCRFRPELSHENLLAQIDLDTAENEPFKICWYLQPTKPHGSYIPPWQPLSEALVIRMVSRKISVLRDFLAPSVVLALEELRQDVGTWRPQKNQVNVVQLTVRHITPLLGLPMPLDRLLWPEKNI